MGSQTFPVIGQPYCDFVKRDLTNEPDSNVGERLNIGHDVVSAAMQPSLNCWPVHERALGAVGGCEWHGGHIKIIEQNKGAAMGALI